MPNRALRGARREAHRPATPCPACTARPPAARAGARRARRDPARPQHAVLVLRAVRVRAPEAPLSRRRGTARRRPHPQRHRHALDRGQQRLDAARRAHAMGRCRDRRPRVRRLVPRQLQPPVVGRHPGPAARPEPPHSAAQVLPEAAAHLRPRDRPRVVGARLPLHAPPLQRVPPAASGEAARRPRDHPPRLPEVRAGADQRHELRGRHALHTRQASRPAFARTGIC